MKKNNFIMCLLTGILLSCSAFVYAGSVSYTVSTAPPVTARDADSTSHTGSFAKTAYLTKFDTALGTLTSIDFSMDGVIMADFTLTNTGVTTMTKATASVFADMVMYVDGNELIRVSQDPWVKTTQNNVLGGQTRIANGLTATFTGTASYSDQWMLDWFTSGAGYVDALSEYAGTGTSTTGASTDLIATINSWAQENITITYNYTDAPPPAVPEPGTIMLMGSGLLMLGGAAASRFRQKI